MTDPQVERDVLLYGTAFTYNGTPLDPTKVVMYWRDEQGHIAPAVFAGQRVRVPSGREGVVKQVHPRVVAVELDGDAPIQMPFSETDVKPIEPEPGSAWWKREREGSWTPPESSEPPAPLFALDKVRVPLAGMTPEMHQRFREGNWTLPDCACHNWAVPNMLDPHLYANGHHPACDGTGQRKDAPSARSTVLHRLLNQPGQPGNPLTDEQVTDIAVKSGWIEDTPEARAAYLAESRAEDQT